MTFSLSLLELTLAVSDTEYLLTFLGLFVVGLVISHFAARASEQARIAQQREEVTASLYAFSRELTGALTLDDRRQVIVRHVSENFHRDVVVLLAGGGRVGHVCLQLRRRHWMRTTGGGHLDLSSRASLPAATPIPCPRPACAILPLKTPRGVVGVLGSSRPRRLAT